MKFIALICLCVISIACTPSEQALQTAIAETQASWTPTPIPTATKNPCSDRGWSDIGIYLKQFDQERGNLVVGSSISAYLDALGNTKDRINDVDIDACTEHARQLIVSGLANEIYGMRVVITGGDQTQGQTTVISGVTMIKNAKAELSTLGIKLDWP
jgi:hypothetical protein